MKFLLLLYDDTATIEALPAADRRALVDEHMAYSRMLRERGALVHGDPVDSPETARTIRFDAADPLVTDGPFLEAKEALGGFYVIEAASAPRRRRSRRSFPALRPGGRAPVDPRGLRPEISPP